MKSHQEQNTCHPDGRVTPMPSREDAALKIARTEFNNWLNGEDAKAEFMMSLHTIQNSGASACMVRYLMQYSYQQGYLRALEAKR